VAHEILLTSPVERLVVGDAAALAAGRSKRNVRSEPVLMYDRLAPAQVAVARDAALRP
jgi:hypothetical protein